MHFFSTCLLLLSVCTAFPKPKNPYFTKQLVLPPPNAIGTPNEYSKELPLLYTNDPVMVSNWLADHCGDRVLGFDVESVPTDPAIMKQTTFRGPATIQLATLKSSIVIQLVNKNGKRTKACAPILNAVLQDESIIKVGCGIDQDLLQLGWKKLEARSRLNLADVISSDQTLGLETLSQSILRINLPKTQSVARSNWSNIPLSDQQLNYAARDAWAGAAIVHALKRRYKCFEPSYLCDYLKGQPSLELLKNQYQCQEQAKTLIKTLLLPYKGNKAAVPRWKKTYIGQVNRLEKDIHLDQLKPLLNATAIGI